MIVTGCPTAYVDPFDRICHGLGNEPATTDPKEAHFSVPDRRNTRKIARRIGNNDVPTENPNISITGNRPKARCRVEFSLEPR